MVYNLKWARKHPVPSMDLGDSIWSRPCLSLLPKTQDQHHLRKLRTVPSWVFPKFSGLGLTRGKSLWPFLTRGLYRRNSEEKEHLRQKMGASLRETNVEIKEIGKEKGSSILSKH